MLRHVVGSVIYKDGCSCLNGTGCFNFPGLQLVDADIFISYGAIFLQNLTYMIAKL